MKVAVIGGGISGLSAAHEIAKAGVEVVLYEKEAHLGGHAKTINVDGIDIDLGFMGFNRVSYPYMTELVDGLDIDVEAFDMSYSLSLDEGQGCEWSNRNGLRSLFAQKSNALKPNFWGMLHEITRFKDDVIMYLEGLENNAEMDRTETLGHFIKFRSYSELFQKAYLIPMCASIWCCPSDKVMDFSAFSVLSFCRSHHLLQFSGGPQWLAIRGRSQQFVNKLREELEVRGSHIRTSCEVHYVSTSDKGCTLFCRDGSEDLHDRCIIAVPAPNAIKILGNEVTHEEMRILGAFQYVYSDIYLHHDTKFMPRNKAVWSALNFQGSTDGTVCLTYWLNVLQNISETFPFLLTLNPPRPPENLLLKSSTGVLVPSVAAMKASLELDYIQGKRGIWFCGACHGYEFHEDALKSGFIAANAVLRRSLMAFPTPKYMTLSWTEMAARHYITEFLKHFISAGCLILLEDGGTVLKFEGLDKRCTWKTAIKVHNPQFYWKVVMEADFGMADAFINGDISFVDNHEGLLNFFRIFLANMHYLYPSVSTSEKRSLGSKGWWTPMFLTAGIASAKYFYRHVSRRNSVTLARQNVARHYDLSNEMFSLFLDETMTYSCAIFKNESEDLKVAQLRKIHLLIEKARIEKHHEVLEIGCGWGTLAIELVKKVGCQYTGITLAEEQLKFAEVKVKEAGLQDHIRFLLCDYRQLPVSRKFDRIISCEMIEQVGDEYLEDFFCQCDSVLADNGLFVLQTISIPDGEYNRHKRCSDFVREYIFPGVCLPSLNRLTSAMTAASRLCVEHVENIGAHYGKTLRCWRKRFLDNQSKIGSLGFDGKFMRAWEYYFDYCASGFMTRNAGDYQIVFSRQGNLVAFGDPYASIPTSHSCP